MLVEPFALAAVEDLVARIVPGVSSVYRVSEGVSTYVYRVERADKVLYLRVLPEVESSFAPEVLVHRLLREKSARVPDVVYWEHRDPQLQHSIMFTTAIPGTPLAENVRSVLLTAGRDLARINSIPVDGFGWIRRDTAEVAGLRAEHTSHRDFLLESVEVYLGVLEQSIILERHEIAAIKDILTGLDRLFDVAQAHLAHGDFDAIHIFSHHGEYSGIIDFGEIRGTDQLYDLGHFQIENSAMLPYLLEGYASEIDLPEDYQAQIDLWSLLIAVRRLARRPTRPLPNPDLLAIRRSIAQLNGVRA